MTLVHDDASSRNVVWQQMRYDDTWFTRPRDSYCVVSDLVAKLRSDSELVLMMIAQAYVVVMLACDVMFFLVEFVEEWYSGE